MAVTNMSAFGNRDHGRLELHGAAIPPTTASTTRQVTLQFSQRGFLPRRSYDSMPSKEVLLAETRSGQRGGGDPPLGPPTRRGTAERAVSFPLGRRINEKLDQ